MKGFAIKFVLFVCLAATLLIPACKKHKCNDPSNKDCENYDPCYGKHKVNTFFVVKEGTGGWPPPPDWCPTVACDTLSTYWAQFDVPIGNTDNCKYEWKIGTDTSKYTKKSFQLNFGDWVSKGHKNEPLTITLTIRRPKDACLDNPADTMIKSSRNIVFADEILWTKFTGYYENDQNKSVTISMISQIGGYFRGHALSPSNKSFFLVGLPTADTICISNNCGKGNSYYKGGISDATGCEMNDFNGYLFKEELKWINPDMVVEKFTFNAPFNKNTYVFHGRRVK